MPARVWTALAGLITVLLVAVVGLDQWQARRGEASLFGLPWRASPPPAASAPVLPRLKDLPPPPAVVVFVGGAAEPRRLPARRRRPAGARRGGGWPALALWEGAPRAAPQPDTDVLHGPRGDPFRHRGPPRSAHGALSLPRGLP